MSKKQSNPPAPNDSRPIAPPAPPPPPGLREFPKVRPKPSVVKYRDMDLRDYFAGIAMRDLCPKEAYEYADRMMAARKRRE